ncbi:O-antigen ligase family protein [Chitinilyticum aquatile]|uniref:O-antigen ligase family protein n=1 Tax=Chitinilyticum aquatile TaxID=362520 RepID=UPI0004134809|nr:O-antigen ligase family protein [Chitinilyticum aquatile]
MQILKPTFDRIALAAAVLLLAIGPLAHVRGLRFGCVAILAAWLLYQFVQDRSSLQMPGWQSLLAFCGLAALSLKWSVAPDLTIKHLWQDLLLPLITAFACYRLASEAGNSRWLAGATVVYILLLAGISLSPTDVLFFDGDRPGMAFYYPGLGESSTLACYILPVWLVVLVRGNLFLRLVAGVALLATLYVGYASLNRMFWIAALASTAVFLLLYRPISKRTILALLLVCSATAAVGYVAFAKRLAVYNIKSDQALSTTIAVDQRPAAWKFWLTEAGNHLLLGKGFGRYTPAGDIQPHRVPGLIMPDMNAPRSLAHSHSLLLNIVLQLGFPGLLLFGIVVFQIMRRMIRAIRTNQGRVVAAGGIALLVAVFMKNATDDFVNGTPGILLWAYIGIALALCQNALNNKDSGIEAESR